MSKNAWTPAEYALLLRAWLDVLTQDTDKSKAAVKTRVYEHFCELSEDKSKRTLNATTLQRAVLSFNFSFISQYNLAHGANAWASLSRDEREQVYNREKTTSYYFVDLDPGMIASLTAIRKLIASGSAKAEAAASGPGSKASPGRPMKKRGPKPKTEAGNARAVYRAIIDAKGSNEDDGVSESGTSESSSGSDDDSSDLSSDVKNKRVKKRYAKHHRHQTPVKRPKSHEATILEALDSLKKDVRRVEKLITRDQQHGRREDAPVAKMMKKSSQSSTGDEKTKRSQASKPRLEAAK